MNWWPYWTDCHYLWHDSDVGKVHIHVISFISIQNKLSWFYISFWLQHAIVILFIFLDSRKYLCCCSQMILNCILHLLLSSFLMNLHHTLWNRKYRDFETWVSINVQVLSFFIIHSENNVYLLCFGIAIDMMKTKIKAYPLWLLLTVN